MNRRLILILCVAVALVPTCGLPAAERPKISVTVLYDNYGFDEACGRDWGFACLITGTEKTILFDTGNKGDLLLENFRKLGANPQDVDLAVISHNHGDHTGGLGTFLEKTAEVSVYLPAATPEAFVKEVEGRASRVTVVTKPVEVCKHVVVLGPMGDKIVEQALVVQTRKGLVIITGCSHPGIVDIAKRAREELGREIHMIVGGMHLLRHSEDDLQAIVSDLKGLGIRKVAATHCTGDKAIALFKTEFGEGFVKMGTGRVLDVDGP